MSIKLKLIEYKPSNKGDITSLFSKFIKHKTTKKQPRYHLKRGLFFKKKLFFRLFNRNFSKLFE